MGKIISRHYPVRLVNVTRMKSENKKDWQWRKLYIGHIGCLEIRESEEKHPGKRYAVFDCEGFAELRTSYGTERKTENGLIFVTENSRYEFENGKEMNGEWQEENKAREV